MFHNSKTFSFFTQTTDPTKFSPEPKIPAPNGASSTRTHSALFFLQFHQNPWKGRAPKQKHKSPKLGRSPPKYTHRHTQSPPRLQAITTTQLQNNQRQERQPVYLWERCSKTICNRRRTPTKLIATTRTKLMFAKFSQITPNLQKRNWKNWQLHWIWIN